MGALTLTANSTLNYTLSAGTLTFASFSPGSFVLSITDYIGDGTAQGFDQLIFNQDQASQLASYNFGFGPGVNVSEFDLNNGFFEVYSTAPVPEPSTWVAGALALGVLGFSQRKRFAKKLRAAQVLKPGLEIFVAGFQLVELTRRGVPPWRRPLWAGGSSESTAATTVNCDQRSAAAARPYFLPSAKELLVTRTHT
jgi:hypothetical protein